MTIKDEAKIDPRLSEILLKKVKVGKYRVKRRLGNVLFIGVGEVLGSKEVKFDFEGSVDVLKTMGRAPYYLTVHEDCVTFHCKTRELSSAKPNKPIARPAKAARTPEGNLFRG